MGLEIFYSASGCSTPKPEPAVGEELDSERFHHGRTQAELKARAAELDTAQKGRTLAESLLTAARGKPRLRRIRN